MCPRACRLRDGQRGFCWVRARRGDTLVLAAWGRSSGFCVDPIEKKPLHHFLPGTAVLSFGTIGCNLACRYCQNADLSRAHDESVLADSAEPEVIARAALDLGCRSVAFTYNEPVIFLEYVVDVARACRALGIATVAVTAGYVSGAARREMFEHIDAANVDLKSIRDDFYQHLSLGHLAPVLETLEYLAHETRVWLELTTLVIPGLNDSDAEIDELSRWVAGHLGRDVPLHLTAFHPAGSMLDVPRTPHATLTHAREISRRNGLRHVYVGNVPDRDAASTWCAACGERLVTREGYSITGWALGEDGRCARCGAPCPGRFESAPGRWGARQAFVRLGRVEVP